MCVVAPHIAHRGPPGGVNTRLCRVDVSGMVVSSDEHGRGEMTTSIINGVELYYEIRDTGEPLVLTHGSWPATVQAAGLRMPPTSQG